jgi:hypothetical protein
LPFILTYYLWIHPRLIHPPFTNTQAGTNVGISTISQYHNTVPSVSPELSVILGTHFLMASRLLTTHYTLRQPCSVLSCLNPTVSERTCARSHVTFEGGWVMYVWGSGVLSLPWTFPNPLAVWTLINPSAVSKIF